MLNLKDIDLVWLGSFLALLCKYYPKLRKVFLNRRSGERGCLRDRRPALLLQGEPSISWSWTAAVIGAVIAFAFMALVMTIHRLPWVLPSWLVTSLDYLLSFDVGAAVLSVDSYFRSLPCLL